MPLGISQRNQNKSYCLMMLWSCMETVGFTAMSPCHLSDETHVLGWVDNEYKQQVLVEMQTLFRLDCWGILYSDFCTRIDSIQEFGLPSSLQATASKKNVLPCIAMFWWWVCIEWTLAIHRRPAVNVLLIATHWNSISPILNIKINDTDDVVLSDGGKILINNDLPK